MRVRRPDGPKSHWPWGSVPLAAADPLAVYQGWARRYGDIFHYRVLWKHIYFLNNPDYIDYVLVRNARNFQKDPTTRNVRWLLGDGLLTSEGEQWRQHRRLIQPAFHRERIAGYAGIMTGSVLDALAGWRDGGEIDIHREMMQVTLRVVVRCLFGVESGETATISRSMDLLMRNNTGLRLLMPARMRRLPLPGAREFWRAVEALDGAVAAIIAQRRASGPGGSDLLGLLMAARDEEGGALNDREIRDEVMTFFLAGHETTALALSWSFYALSRDAEAARKLREEVDGVLGGRVAGTADLPSLPWTEAVLKETMRLYPPAWALGRVALDECEIGGYRVPRGTMLVMSPWVMHRDERHFPDAEKFDPARWRNGATENLPRFAYFPFGGGPRQCIGSGFAMMEAMLALATIAQRFEVKTAEHVAPVTGFTLRPKGGIPARVTRR